MSPSPATNSPHEFTLTRLEEHIFTAFASITLCNSIELIILCLATFKRYHGVYFWALFVSSCSLIINCLGFTLLFFVSVSAYLSVTIVLLGWCGMVTGHSIVLWSRLHFVLHRPKVLRAILYLIIANAISLGITVAVLLYGVVTPYSRMHDGFVHAYDIVERIQLVVFCCQEYLLSGIYIWETSKLLQLRPEGAAPHPHRVILMQLLAINIVILVLDVVVVVFQYCGLFSLQVVFKPVAYSIKLRLEYAILGRLVQIATNPGFTGVGEESPSVQAPNTGGLRWMHGRDEDYRTDESSRAPSWSSRLWRLKKSML